MPDYNDHHKRVLAKQFWAQTLAVMVGLREGAEPQMHVSQLERNDRRWQKVLRSLEDGGYIRILLYPTGADRMFIITEKIAGEVDCEPYTGSVRVGSPNEPLALWLSPGIMRQVCMDLIESKAGLSIDDRRARRVIATEGEVGTFAEWLTANLRTLARKYTDIGNSTAQDLRLAFVDGQVGETVEAALDDRTKELERLKREIDSLRALRVSVECSGGWDGFVAACRQDFSTTKGTKNNG